MARHGDGLYLRGQTWYLDCRLNGARHVVRLGKGIARHAAKEIAQVTRGAILKGEIGIGKKAKDLSFDEARKKFETWSDTNHKPTTAKYYRECLRRLATTFHGTRLSQISSFLVEQHKKARKEAGAPIRANRELAVLHTLFTCCREWKVYEGENPVAGVKHLKEPRGRLRFLEPEEEQTLLEAASPVLRQLIILGVNTGLRIKAEALRLRWADIDVRRGLLTVPAAYAKSGRTRTVSLNDRARAALTELRDRTRGDFVFSKPNGQPYQGMEKPFTRLCRTAGLAGTGLSLHTLRHTFASRLCMAGVDLRTVQEEGGWSSLDMVQRYAHVSPSHKAEAVQRIADLFHNAVHNTPESRAVVELAERRVSM